MNCVLTKVNRVLGVRGLTWNDVADDDVYIQMLSFMFLCRFPYVPSVKSKLSYFCIEF
jgi:hypothetical protein